MRKFIGPLALAAAAGFSARAENTAVDYSDLWWNPVHSGWGLGLDRQGGVMFATLFTYADDGSATWLSASSVQATNGDETSWSGKLYRTTGPGFASPFDPASVGITEVGALRVDFSTARNGTLTYSVDGKTVVEPIERITFRAPSIAGTYTGGMSATTTGCGDPSFDGDYDVLGPFAASQSGSRVTMSFTSFPGDLPSSCTFTGEYSQAGRLGRVQGTWQCSLYWAVDGRVGTFTLDDVVVTINGFAGKLSAKDQDCNYKGRVGAVRQP
jgi:hypothetical protein